MLGVSERVTTEEHFGVSTIYILVKPKQFYLSLCLCLPLSLCLCLCVICLLCSYSCHAISLRVV